MSNDGKKLFTSYFKLDGVNIKNNLTAYNFGTVGQNENADRMVGGYSFEEEMIPKVEFITNDIVAAFSDKEILLYNMKEKPSERGKAEYGTEISSIFYSEEYLGTIKSNPDSGSSADYIMTIYDNTGKKDFDYAFSMTYDKVYAAEDEVIITGGNQCLIVQRNGRTKFSYTFDNMIKSMIPSSKPGPRSGSTQASCRSCRIEALRAQPSPLRPVHCRGSRRPCWRKNRRPV